MEPCNRPACPCPGLSRPAGWSVRQRDNQLERLVANRRSPAGGEAPHCLSAMAVVLSAFALFTMVSLAAAHHRAAVGGGCRLEGARIGRCTLAEPRGHPA